MPIPLLAKPFKLSVLEFAFTFACLPSFWAANFDAFKSLISSTISIIRQPNNIVEQKTDKCVKHRKLAKVSEFYKKI
ncbi:MAG: hypothetical protein LBP59_05250 [Planctomycetaceae bacterium]|nr:hypothetical protein [Planctomycetaceae bacterium]